MVRALPGNMLRLAVLLILLIPSPAPAATVTSQTSCDEHGYCDKSVTFRADPGEANQLTARRDEQTVTFTDVVPIQPGKGCRAVAGGAACTATAADTTLGSVGIYLGDGDDVASVAGVNSVWGGAGNDRITGSGTLSGGPGSDELTAVAGAVFVDDDGSHPAPDRYVGGPGAQDTVSYEGRKTSVDIDLSRAENAGDTFIGIENATGGNGDDRLIGTDGPNTLAGGRGHDRVSGRGGDDQLSGAVVDGGAGDDQLSGAVLDGGDGDDALEASKVADCGAGKDAAITVELGHVYVRASCESVEVGTSFAFRLHRPPAHAFLTNTECYCRYAHYIAKVRGVVVAQTVLPRVRYGYVPRHVAMRLNARGRRMLARHRRLLADLSFYDLHQRGYGAPHEHMRLELIRAAFEPHRLARRARLPCLRWRFQQRVAREFPAGAGRPRAGADDACGLRGRVVSVL